MRGATMLKTIEEVKEFITWAKENKVKNVKLEGIEFEVSDIAFVDALHAPEEAYSELTSFGSKDLLDTEEINEEEEEDLLYYSSDLKPLKG